MSDGHQGQNRSVGWCFLEGGCEYLMEKICVLGKLYSGVSRVLCHERLNVYKSIMY